MRFAYIFLSLIFYIPSVSLAGIFDWNTSNIQILRGFDYEVGKAQRTIITLEHAHGWALGDTFAFIDYISRWPE